MFYRVPSIRLHESGRRAAPRRPALQKPDVTIEGNAKRGHAKRGFCSMEFGTLSQLIGSFALDDSSLALIALLAGMAGGWMINNWRDQQLRTKKLKVERK